MDSHDDWIEVWANFETKESSYRQQRMELRVDDTRPMALQVEEASGIQGILRDAPLSLALAGVLYPLPGQGLCDVLRSCKTFVNGPASFSLLRTGEVLVETRVPECMWFWSGDEWISLKQAQAHVAQDNSWACDSFVIRRERSGGLAFTCGEWDACWFEWKTPFSHKRSQTSKR